MGSHSGQPVSRSGTNWEIRYDAQLPSFCSPTLMPSCKHSSSQGSYASIPETHRLEKTLLQRGKLLGARAPLNLNTGTASTSGCLNVNDATPFNASPPRHVPRKVRDISGPELRAMCHAVMHRQVPAYCTMRASPLEAASLRTCRRPGPGRCTVSGRWTAQSASYQSQGGRCRHHVQT